MITITKNLFDRLSKVGCGDIKENATYCEEASLLITKLVGIVITCKGELENNKKRKIEHLAVRKQQKKAILEPLFVDYEKTKVDWVLGYNPHTQAANDKIATEIKKWQQTFENRKNTIKSLAQKKKREIKGRLYYAETDLKNVYKMQKCACSKNASQNTDQEFGHDPNNNSDHPTPTSPRQHISIKSLVCQKPGQSKVRSVKSPTRFQN